MQRTEPQRHRGRGEGRSAPCPPCLCGLFLLAACPPPAYQAKTPDWVSDTSSFSPASGAQTTIATEYRAVAAKIITAARADHGAFDKLQELTDRIGHRL